MITGLNLKNSYWRSEVADLHCTRMKFKKTNMVLEHKVVKTFTIIHFKQFQIILKRKEKGQQSVRVGLSGFCAVAEQHATILKHHRLWRRFHSSWK